MNSNANTLTTKTQTPQKIDGFSRVSSESKIKTNTMNTTTDTTAEDKTVAMVGGVKSLLAKNTAERNDLSWELQYTEGKLRHSKEAHIFTLGRLAKYEDGIVAEALQFAREAGMFISCDSSKIGLKSQIRDYQTKAGKVFKAHFSIYDNYLGKCSDKEWGDEPKSYNGNFLYKTYEAEFAKWKHPIEPQTFQKLDDLFDFNPKVECSMCGDDKSPLTSCEIGQGSNKKKINRLFCGLCMEELYHDRDKERELMGAEDKDAPAPPAPEPEVVAPAKKARGRPKKVADPNAEPKPKKPRAKKVAVADFKRVEVGLDEIGSCGVRLNQLYIPLCRMGAIGENALLLAPITSPIHYHTIPKKMDLDFFEGIARRFQTYPLADYDSCSLMNNIIKPNLDKIMADCGVSSPKIRARIDQDTWVFLNSWFEQKDADDDDDDDDEYIIPNKQSFLLDADVEY
jgi:hypothetical protein